MRSIIDWYSLATDNLFSERGKLATIWFDQIVLHVPTEDLIEKAVDTLKATHRLSDDTVKGLLDAWVPHQKLSGKNEFIDSAVWDRADSKIRDAVIAELQKQERERFGAQHADSFAEMREVALGGAGFLAALELWKLLNEAGPTSFFGNEDSSKLFSAAVGASDTSNFRNFEKVALIPMPDLSAISWDQIIELKNSQYFFDFRSKLNKIASSVEHADGSELKELIGEMKLAEMRTVVRAAEPNIGMATVNAVVGWIPILDNIGKVRDARDVLKAVELKRQSGWLYFLMDMEDAATK